MSTSEAEELRAARIEDLASIVVAELQNKGAAPPDIVEKLRRTLQPLHTPLVSDEELCKWRNKWGDQSPPSALAHERELGALYMRKLADVIWERYRAQDGAVDFAYECTDIIRKWADEEEASHDK